MGSPRELAARAAPREQAAGAGCICRARLQAAGEVPPRDQGLFSPEKKRKKKKGNSTIFKWHAKPMKTFFHNVKIN